VRIHRGQVRTLLASALLLLLGADLASAQNSLINLGTLPGLTPPEARVGTAIDTLCPKLAAVQPTLNPSQLDLLQRCSDMKTPGSRGLGIPALSGTLANVWPNDTTVQGPTAVETKSIQLRTIGARLSALRLGATGISLNGVPLGGERVASAAGVENLGRGGGGASADRDPFGRLGLFINGVGGFGNKDATSREAGYDFHTAGVTAGADYRFTDALVAGLAVSYLRSDASLDLSLGDVDSNSYGLGLYGTYYVGAFYVDLLGGFTRNDYDTTRRIVYGPAPGFTGASVDRTATGDTHGWQYTFNGGAGYDFHRGPLTVTPYARVEYLHLDIDGFTEGGADGLDLKVQKQTVESLLAILGGRTGYAISVPFGVLVPQLHGEWRHEILNDKRSITAQFANDPFGVPFLIATDDPDRDYFAVGAGLSAQFGRGVSAFLDFETILGLRDVTSYNFAAGVRIAF
jgi:outer membrane lipase/esterase